MKIYHGRVVGERRPMSLSGLKEKRTIEIEWIDEESNQDERFKSHCMMTVSDLKGEFAVGDAVSITLTKVM